MGIVKPKAKICTFLVLQYCIHPSNFFLFLSQIHWPLPSKPRAHFPNTGQEPTKLLCLLSHFWGFPKSPLKYQHITTHLLVPRISLNANIWLSVPRSYLLTYSFLFLVFACPNVLYLTNWNVFIPFSSPLYSSFFAFGSSFPFIFFLYLLSLFWLMLVPHSQCSHSSPCLGATLQRPFETSGSELTGAEREWRKDTHTDRISGKG